MNKGWEWDAFDPRLTGPVPSGYVLTTRHQVVEFDYWGLNALASQRFVDLCDAFELNVQAVPVEVVQSGRKPTTKPYYYYLRWGTWASVVDLERSDLTLERDLASGQVLQHLYFPDVPMLATVAEFVVDEEKIPSAAAFPCLDLGYDLVCNDEFRQACESEGLLGVGFEPLTGYRKADFWD
ncbi:imm11 family protein [Nocardioides sp. Bht2]|uniref:imm11 family protein n=1 Tax=Nocardioides sp. Bht2 TaxID=3392297 RepID=UPI0039B572FF